MYKISRYACKQTDLFSRQERSVTKWRILPRTRTQIENCKNKRNYKKEQKKKFLVRPFCFVMCYFSLEYWQYWHIRDLSVIKANVHLRHCSKRLRSFPLGRKQIVFVPKSVRDILLLNLSPATVFDNRETQPDPTSLTVFYFPENKKKKWVGSLSFRCYASRHFANKWALTNKNPRNKANFRAFVHFRISRRFEETCVGNRSLLSCKTSLLTIFMFLKTRLFLAVQTIPY